MPVQGNVRWLPEHILTAAAICMMHPSAVPHQLLVHAVSGLLAIALAAGSSSAKAVVMLSEALQDARLPHWKSVLGDMNLLLPK